MSSAGADRVDVCPVTESDDFDGVARIGMAHTDWSGVLQVLVEDQRAGWWDEHIQPYLVFYSCRRPSEDEAANHVRQAILHSSLNYNADARVHPTTGNPHSPFMDVILTDPDSFQEMAELGRSWGRVYPDVRTYTDSNGVHLRFYVHDTDSPDEDDALKAFFDSMPDL